MSKDTLKLIPYSDVLIQNDGGTLLIDLSNSEKKKITNKMKQEEFETDLVKIEQEKQQFKNKIDSKDDSFSFDSFILHEEKIIIKNQIKTLSILKMFDFDYKKSNRANYLHYKSTEQNKTIREKYIRLWLYYIGKGHVTSDIIINKNGELNNEYQLNEIIYKLYDIKYNNSINKTFTSNIDNILRTIFNNITKQYNKLENKHMLDISLYLFITPIIFIYLMKYVEKTNSVVGSLLKNCYRYMNKDEEQGLSSKSKKIVLGSIVMYYGYFKLHDYITNVIDIYIKNEISTLIFNENINDNEKNNILSYREKMVSFDSLVDNLSLKSDNELFDIINAIPKNKTEDIHIFTNNLVNKLKVEIRKTAILDKTCSPFAKTLIQNNNKLPLFLFTDKDCELRTLRETICAFIICLLKAKDINIFKKTINKTGGSRKKTHKKKYKS